MDIYLAGGISGNCKPMWMEMIKAERMGKLDIYLAGTNGRRWCVDLYLAANWEGIGKTYIHTLCHVDEIDHLLLPKTLEK
jgi:hypothetical protein